MISNKETLYVHVYNHVLYESPGELVVQYFLAEFAP